MITVEHLTKYYGRIPAVDDISFDVAQGEILGFLGPNGAGKTTTMRILTGYMPPTSGRATVAGHDVFKESLEARRHIGYLPETVPLYPEMTPRGYLNFMGKIRGLDGRTRRLRIDDVAEKCKIGDVLNRLIGKLSKGYRQRVGLAQAIVSDPAVLILDEPTIGLDPQQIRSVRALIKSLAGKHTVLISTHILPEVEMMCGRVLIMLGGRVLASDTPENLQRRMAGGSQIIAEIAAPEADLRAALDSLPGVEHFDVSPGEGDYFRCALTPTAGWDLRPAVFALAKANGWELRELTRSRHSLEDIYVRITRPNEEEEG